MNGLVPTGGKYNTTKDRDLLDTAIREVKEETNILLFHGMGVFLDEWGIPMDFPFIVWEEDFLFPDSKKGHDSLYFFWLHYPPKFDLKKGAHWLNRSQYSWSKVAIWDTTYDFRALNVREKILKIMS